MLNDITVFGEVDKVQVAIERLRQYEPSEGYYLAFSGGKDSVTIKALADMAGVKYDAHYNITNVDPPELVQFIKKHHSDVKRERPEITMWRLIVKRGVPPTRMFRYCCRYLKEQGGHGRITITGVRQQESYKRSKRNLYEQSKNDKTKTFLHPIIDWSESEVWEFIHQYNVPYCSLYDEGFKRLGCIGCPMAGTKGQQKEFERWPKYKEAYIRAFDRMVKKAGETERPFRQGENGQQVFDWWLKISGRATVSQCDDDQGVIFE